MVRTLSRPDRRTAHNRSYTDDGIKDEVRGIESVSSLGGGSTLVRHSENGENLNRRRHEETQERVSKRMGVAREDVMYPFRKSRNLMTLTISDLAGSKPPKKQRHKEKISNLLLGKGAERASVT